MKPSLAPCFFSNTSLYLARSAITPLMSTSLKVVSMAAVFCASFSRRAIVWRSFVMRTRSSRAASAAGDGRAGQRAGLARAPVRRAEWPARRCRKAPRTSPFSTWPRLPEPSRAAVSSPLSAAILAAEGAGGIAVLAAGCRLGGRGSLLGGCRRASRPWRGGLRRCGAGLDLAQDGARRDGLAVLRPRFRRARRPRVR